MAWPRLGCLLLVTLNFSSISAQEPLLWKFNVGDQHHYRLTQKMDMEMSLGASNRTVGTDFLQIVDLTWKIEQVGDQGRAKIVQRVDRLQMHLQAPGEQEMHFDTDSEDSPAGFAAILVPLVKALTSEAITFSLSPRGEIEDLEMPESLTKSMEAMPGAAMMGNRFSNNGFQQMIQQSSLVLPTSENLKPGHEWTRKLEQSSEQIGVTQIETTYHYEGPREADGNQLEVFRVNTQLGFDEGPEGVAIRVSDHESTGEILFNRTKGHLESSSLEQELTLVLKSGDNTTTQKMIQNTTFEQVEKPTETDR